MAVFSSDTKQPRISVLVPARNEEVCLGACLQSLVKQAGVELEILVIDDGSADRTRQIAMSFPAVRVVDAPPLPPRWSGKCNALAAGARVADGDWFLFTDADTVHLPGSLERALREAMQHDVAMLSYSPEQEVVTFWEKAVMPVVFAELASTYSPSAVSSPDSPVVAANGQYILIQRKAYESLGGHAAVAHTLLEDVALARLAKRAGFGIRFRLGRGEVRTRMYRSFSELRDGWTKNLALLFPSAGWLAARRAAEALLIMDCMVLVPSAAILGRLGWCAFATGVFALIYGLFMNRIFKAHFGPAPSILALAGLPVFSYLLARSALCYRRGAVSWKGRTYPAVSVV